MNKHERLKRDSRMAVAGLMTVKQAGKAIMSFAQAMGRAARAANDLDTLCGRLVRLTINLSVAKSYTLPKFTIRDHLKDCFGWLTYKKEI